MSSRIVNGWLLERGIALSEKDTSRNGRPRKYPVDELKPGECIEFNGDRAYELARYIVARGREIGFTMTVQISETHGKSLVQAVRLA